MWIFDFSGSWPPSPHIIQKSIVYLLPFLKDLSFLTFYNVLPCVCSLFRFYVTLKVLGPGKPVKMLLHGPLLFLLK